MSAIPIEKRITILMAMQKEAEPLIERLGFKAVAAPWKLAATTPTRLFKARRGKLVLSLVLNGTCATHGVDHIGTQAATLAAQLAISELSPDLLVNAGTAGGFRCRGGEIGKVYLGYDKVFFHDRRIEIPGFDAYGVGAYPTPDTRALASGLGVESGAVSTGNSLDCPPQDLESMNRNGVIAKDMEAAAIAWVASLHGKPLLVLKSITDLVDSGAPTGEEFLRNLHQARERLTDRLIALLDRIEKGETS